VKVLYQNRLCVLVETTGDVAILAHGQHTSTVPLGSAELIVDPTDEQVAEADNGYRGCGPRLHHLAKA